VDQSCADVTAAEGDDVTLECHVTGSPEPTVLWYRHAVLVGSGAQLRVENVSRKKADGYHCVADNGVGQPARCTGQLIVQCQYSVRVRNADLTFNISIHLSDTLISSHVIPKSTHPLDT